MVYIYDITLYCIILHYITFGTRDEKGPMQTQNMPELCEYEEQEALDTTNQKLSSRRTFLDRSGDSRKNIKN